MKPPQPDRMRAKCYGLHDVRTPREPAIHHDLRVRANGRTDLRQNIHRAQARIQLPPAMVRDIHHVHAMIGGDAGVFNRHDALQDQRNVVGLANAGDVAPVEAGLRVLGRLIDMLAPGLVKPAHNVAFPPGIDRRVDGEAKRIQPLGQARLDMFLDIALAAPDIELEDGRIVGVGPDLGLGALGDGGQHHRHAEIARAGGDGGGTLRIADLQPSHRGEADWQTAGLAKEVSGRGDAGDVHQHPRPERKTVERRPVAGKRRLRLGAADQVVPALGRHDGLGGRDEFVERQVFGREIGCHGVSCSFVVICPCGTKGASHMPFGPALDAPYGYRQRRAARVGCIHSRACAT